MIVAGPQAGSDIAILDRIARRDPDGLALLYDRYGEPTFALAYRLLGERDAAEDVVVAAFLAVWRQAAVYDARHGTVRVWLLTTVHRHAVDALRARHARADPATEGHATASEDAPTVRPRTGTIEEFICRCTRRPRSSPPPAAPS